jgi:DNA-binding transcriptional LysR family regulator
MDRLEAMDIFVRIVEAGSFSAVARDLGTTQPTISKQMTALETHLKTRLLNRSTRSLSVTESGTGYYERCKRILEDVKLAEGALGRLQSSLTGTLHVNGSIALGQLFLTPLMLDFQRDYPDLTVELTLNDRYIDLVEEGVDVAVRLGRLADSNLVARRLGSTRRVLVAARDYLDRYSTPQAPADLDRHNCLLYAYLSTGNEWVFRGPQGDMRVQAHGNFKANNGHAIREALLAGAGVALMPDWLVHDDLQAGRLVTLLPQFAPAPLEVNAVYPSGRHVSAKLRTFIEFLQERFKAIPAFAV